MGSFIVNENAVKLFECYTDFHYNIIFLKRIVNKKIDIMKEPQNVEYFENKYKNGIFKEWGFEQCDLSQYKRKEVIDMRQNVIDETKDFCKKHGKRFEEVARSFILIGDDFRSYKLTYYSDSDRFIGVELRDYKEIKNAEPENLELTVTDFLKGSDELYNMFRFRISDLIDATVKIKLTDLQKRCYYQYYVEKMPIYAIATVNNVKEASVCALVKRTHKAVIEGVIDFLNIYADFYGMRSISNGL